MSGRWDSGADRHVVAVMSSVLAQRNLPNDLVSVTIFRVRLIRVVATVLLKGVQSSGLEEGGNRKPEGRKGARPITNWSRASRWIAHQGSRSIGEMSGQTLLEVKPPGRWSEVGSSRIEHARSTTFSWSWSWTWTCAFDASSASHSIQASLCLCISDGGAVWVCDG